MNLDLGFHKPFDRKLYNLNDDRGKKALITILERQGHMIIQTSETMNCDLVSRHYGNVYYHEIEVNNKFNGDWAENYKYVRCFARKYRLVQKYPFGLIFWQFNNDLSQVWKYRGHDLKDIYLRDAYGRGIYDGEKMFHIPVNKCMLYCTETDRELKYYKEKKRCMMVYDDE